MVGETAHIDRGSWWRLALAAVGGPVLWVALALSYQAFGDAPSSTFVLVGALVMVVVAPLGTWWGWRQRGGRLAMVETGRWVREGSVPDDVPELVWRSRVGRFEDDLTMGLVGAVLGAVVVGLSVSLALGGSPAHLVSAACWGLLCVSSLRRWVIWRRPTRALLNRPSALVHSRPIDDRSPPDQEN